MTQEDDAMLTPTIREPIRKNCRLVNAIIKLLASPWLGDGLLPTIPETFDFSAAVQLWG